MRPFQPFSPTGREPGACRSYILLAATTGTADFGTSRPFLRSGENDSSQRRPTLGRLPTSQPTGVGVCGPDPFQLCALG